jgi:hypothetical protein
MQDDETFTVRTVTAGAAFHPDSSLTSPAPSSETFMHNPFQAAFLS